MFLLSRDAKSLQACLDLAQKLLWPAAKQWECATEGDGK